MERISDIIESIANEKNLEIEDVKERVIRALINTAKRVYGENYEYDVSIDANKNLKLYQMAIKFHQKILIKGKLLFVL